MHNMILILVQARMTSSRFPGKVLKEIQGKPIIIHQLDRIAQIKTKVKLVVITSDQESDDQLVQIVKENGYDVFRGSMNDLLDRHYQAALFYNASVIVKIPSDCPLIDPQVIDRVLAYYNDHQDKFDFVSNLHPASYPDGNDVEVMSFSALTNAWKHATKSLEREHTTPYFWENPAKFSIGNVLWESGLKLDMTHRFTLDYMEDFEFIKQVYDRLYPAKENFSLLDILNLLDQEPQLMSLNEMYAGVNWYRHHLDDLKTIDSSQTKL
jgi:spore coat polysaccharide biosynthesis protein SpsF